MYFYEMEMDGVQVNINELICFHGTLMYSIDLGFPIIALIFYFTWFVLGMSNGRYGMFRESAVGSTRPKGNFEYDMYLFHISSSNLDTSIIFVCYFSMQMD